MALKNIWHMTTSADRTIIVVLIIIAIFSFMYKSESDKGAYVVIEGPEGLYSRNPLSLDTILRPSGRIGHTSIQISNRAVRVMTSACPLKICVAQGSISHVGELIACVPNGILIYVEGIHADEVQGRVDRGYDHISR